MKNDLRQEWLLAWTTGRSQPYLKLNKRKNCNFGFKFMNNLIVYSNIIKIGAIKIITYIFSFIKLCFTHFSLALKSDTCAYIIINKYN